LDETDGIYLRIGEILAGKEFQIVIQPVFVDPEIHRFVKLLDSSHKTFHGKKLGFLNLGRCHSLSDFIRITASCFYAIHCGNGPPGISLNKVLWYVFPCGEDITKVVLGITVPSFSCMAKAFNVFIVVFWNFWAASSFIRD